ncbi:cyanophycinase [Elstera cyanobacteriorum]|uniref:cyanophycinase n=1 Tax=Elstera cyanobacteriorum TaxID=2022747 RepID=UPI002355C7CC|nr:cyanophycinase [Elstera cyanobacteriorum]MCK6443826.1 cyanophycinase [Elstera cyanobacteriorum]
MRSAMIAGLLAGVALVGAALPATAQTAGNGALMIIGGALRPETNEVWTRLVTLAGGPGAKIIVIPAAAGSPQRTGEAAVATLKKFGAEADLVQIGPRYKDIDLRKAANDPANVAKIKAATGIYFLGGDQARITQALVEPDGKPSAVLSAIWEIYRAGGVISGTSAGAAIMSETMFKDPPPVLDVLKQGIVPGKTIDKGLGFLTDGWFVDQHFLARGRFPRALAAMQATGMTKGFGVDEDTAAVVRAGKLEVIGYSGVVLLDTSAAKGGTNAAPFSIQGAKLSYLDRGDSYDFKTGAILPNPVKDPAKDKLDPAAADYKPYNEDPEAWPTILGNRTLVEAMGNLIDNKQTEQIGLAVDLRPNAPNPDIGFEFKLYKGPGSLGWYSSALGGDSYTVKDIYLDVRPVLLPKPLYSPK